MTIRSNPVAGHRLLPLAAILLMLGASPAAAQQDPSAMDRFLDAIGLIELPKDRINYRERAPLVVPPSQALVPPRSADDMRAVNPDWPVDHDARHRTANKKSEDERYTDPRFYEGQRLSPDEMRRGTSLRPARSPDAIRSETYDFNRLLPSQLGFKGWGSKKEEQTVFTGEPERRLLTEPPPGLRTPSTDAPYGVVSTKPGPFKRDPFDRGVDNISR